jgi:hypothetical protein
MSSLVPDDLSRSKNTPVQTINDRPTISLANQLFDIPTNPLPTDSQSTSIRLIEKISTYYIWSIFNLLLLPFGIFCCYFSHKVSQLKIQNRYETANKWSHRTFVLNIITTLLMIGIIITIVMLRYDFVYQNPDLQLNQTLTTIPYIPWQPGR